MDKCEIIERLKNIAGYAVHTVGEEPFVMSLDDGIAVHEAIELLNKPDTNCSEISNNWIPCSERLPDDLAEVNVTWINHKPEPYYDFVKDKPFTASAVYYKGDWYWYSSVCADLLAEYGKNEIDKIDDSIEITAWMPLPEAYQEGGE